MSRTIHFGVSCWSNCGKRRRQKKACCRTPPALFPWRESLALECVRSRPGFVLVPIWPWRGDNTSLILQVEQCLHELVPVRRPALRWLRLFRPAAIDLVLSKMMCGNDPQDMVDAELMIRHDRITEAQLLEAFTQMKPIELVELRNAFAKAEPLVLKMARDVKAPA